MAPAGTTVDAVKPLVGLAAAVFSAAAVTAAALAFGGPVGPPRSAVTEPDAGGALRACLMSASVEQAEVCMADQAGHLAEQLGLPAALAAIEAEFTAGVVGANCHDVLHLFGKQTAAKLGAGAVVDEGAFCEGGFYHGLISTLGDPAASEACDRLTDYAQNVCWHGVGHAAYDKLGPDAGPAVCPDRGDADLHDICLQGLFMELSLAIGDPTGTALADHCPAGPTFEMCAWGLVSTKSGLYPALMLDWCREYTGLGGDNPIRCRMLVGSGLAYSVTLTERSAQVIHQNLIDGCAGDLDCVAGGVVGVSLNTLDDDLALAVCRRSPELADDRCRIWAQGINKTLRDGS